MSMKTLLLYTTDGCHLCEKAEQQLEFLRQQGVVQWQPVEISDSHALMESYGTRIPVVVETEGDREIGWPFELEQLHQWVNEGLTIETR